MTNNTMLGDFSLSEIKIAKQVIRHFDDDETIDVVRQYLTDLIFLIVNHPELVDYKDENE